MTQILLRQTKILNQLNKLANNDFDFLSDQKKGGLCLNENGSGKGFSDDGIIAILIWAPDLTFNNLWFVWY